MSVRPTVDPNTFSGEYKGSFYIAATVTGKDAAAYAVAKASTHGYLKAPDRQYPVGTGKRRVAITISKTNIKMIDTVTREAMQTLEFDLIIAVDKCEDCVVYTSRTLDQRLAVKIAHVVKINAPNRFLSTLKPRILGRVPSDVTMVSKDTPDVSVAEVYYLGFIKVTKPKGSMIVQGAIKENFRTRTVLNQRRQERHLPKSSRLMGVSKSDHTGTHVSEYPIVVIMSQRSMRITDIITGETISKFFMAQITFQGPVVYKSKPDVYGMITQNHKNMQSNCHLFFMDTGLGKLFHTKLQAALKASQVKIEKTIFSALDGYQREKAPEDLFRKQIRRGHLVPDKCLGAGEYGEVYLATQQNVLESRKSTKIISKYRAVKLLKAGANTGAKEEFIRECQMLMMCEGPGIVRMVGVAVQQAPWLCVLEYMPYGDLRSFLKEADEKNISLSMGESVSLCLQLARGCHFVAKAGVIHMDLAARNVLLGNRNEVKIADFGMSRSLEDGKEVIEFKTPIRVAIKWTAMEAMMENRFSFASDCWSLGIVFWEILTMGQMPYAHVSNMDMLYFLIGGDRVVQPLGCPEDFWAILYKCWSKEPEDRWKFSDLVVEMEDLKLNYPILKPRDLGEFVKKSKGEKSAPQTKARVPNPLANDGEDEAKYVYDVPLPNEDSYDVPLEPDARGGNNNNDDNDGDDGDDAYDIPLQDENTAANIAKKISAGEFGGDDDAEREERAAESDGEMLDEHETEDGRVGRDDNDDDDDDDSVGQVNDDGGDGRDGGDKSIDSGPPSTPSETKELMPPPRPDASDKPRLNDKPVVNDKPLVIDEKAVASETTQTPTIEPRGAIETPPVETPPSAEEPKVVEPKDVETKFVETKVEELPPPNDDVDPTEEFNDGFGDDFDEESQPKSPQLDDTEESFDNSGFGAETKIDVSPTPKKRRDSVEGFGFDETASPKSVESEVTVTTPTPTPTTATPTSTNNSNDNNNDSNIHDNSIANNNNNNNNNNNDNNNHNNNNNNDNNFSTNNNNNTNATEGRLTRSGSVYEGFELDDKTIQTGSRKIKRKKKKKTALEVTALNRDAIEQDFLGSLRRPGGAAKKEKKSKPLSPSTVDDAQVDIVDGC